MVVDSSDFDDLDFDNLIEYLGDFNHHEGPGAHDWLYMDLGIINNSANSAQCKVPQVVCNTSIDTNSVVPVNYSPLPVAQAVIVPEPSAHELKRKLLTRTDLMDKSNKFKRARITPTLVTDIRCQYPSMFASSLDSVDFSSFVTFLSRHASPDFTYVQTVRKVISGFTATTPRSIQLQGVQSTAQYWYNMMQIVPDVAYLLLNTNFHTWNTTKCSKVVSIFDVSATRIFDVTHADLVTIGSATVPSEDFVVSEGNCNENVEVISKRPEEDASRGTVVVDVDSAVFPSSSPLASTAPEPQNLNMSCINTTAINDHLARSQLLDPPVSRQFKAKLTFYLDAEQRIQRIEFQIGTKETLLKKTLVRK